LYCIGDANGKLMLAHAASAQGISGKWFYQYFTPNASFFCFSFFTLNTLD